MSTKTECDESYSSMAVHAAVIQVYPLVERSDESLRPSLSAPFVKFFLSRMQRSSIMYGENYGLKVLWDELMLQVPATSVILHGSLQSITPSNNDSDVNMNDVLKQIQSQLNDPRRCLSVVPIIYIPSEDPISTEGVPCLIRIHSPLLTVVDSLASNINSTIVHRPFLVTDSTIVQLCTPIQIHAIAPTAAIVECLRRRTPPRYIPHNSLHHHIMGNIDILTRNVMNTHSDFYEDNSQAVFSCYDNETIQSLTLRLSMLLSRTVYIGTTSDAFHSSCRKIQQMDQLEQSLRLFWSQKSSSLNVDLDPDIHSSSSSSSPPPSKVMDQPSSFVNYGAITVHDPFPGSGKTTLVKTIAQKILHCDFIHIINGAAFFAKYGASSADSALESMLHSLILSSAINRDHGSNVGSICIILDHLESFVATRILDKGTSGLHDPFNPALTAMTSYLSQFVHSITKKSQVPFPSKNVLYNYKGRRGIILPIRVCLVGVVTCDDNVGRIVDSPSMGSILNVLGENRFRMAEPSSATRLEAFRQAFASRNIQLSRECIDALPILAAKANRARGRTFMRIADALKNEVGGDIAEVSLHTLEKVMNLTLGSESSITSNYVSFHIASASKSDETTADMFTSVGGNWEAKRALIEALALDPRKRRLMASCGLTTPSGVLLYGPPGTGKTMLARATSETMQRATESGLSGAFISIRASDIILSDIGGSEKLLVETFETARRNSPSVIFIDEFEAIFNSNFDGGSGAKGNSRLANTLLQCMDDAKRWRDTDFAAMTSESNTSTSSQGMGTTFTDTKGRVIILAATNAPWNIDRAFLRPGRFSKVVYVGLPDLHEREIIMKVTVERMKLQLGDFVSLDDTVRFISEQIASVSEGFSGADLVGLCRAAAVLCLHEHGSDAMNLGVAYHHFALAREKIQPSCDPSLVERLQRWRVHGHNKQ